MPSAIMLKGRSTEFAESGQSGERGITQTYLLEGVPSLAIPMQGGILGLPLLGVDSHPTEPGLIARRITKRSIGGDHAEIDVEFSNKANIAIFEQTDLTGGRFEWRATFEDTVATIPFAIYSPVKVGNSTVNAWHIVEDRNEERQQVVQVTWHVQTSDVPSMMAAFRSQDKHVHKFGNDYFMFQLTSIEPFRSGVLEVLASWRLDPKLH